MELWPGRPGELFLLQRFVGQLDVGTHTSVLGIVISHAKKYALAHPTCGLDAQQKNVANKIQLCEIWQVQSSITIARRLGSEMWG